MNPQNAKAQLELAILNLEHLLEKQETAESEYQHFFEKNPIVFKVLRYSHFYPFTKESGKSLPQDEHTGLKPEPDFIVEAESGLFEIFEIKTPISKKLIIDSNEYRERFTAEISSYISQTVTYEHYFSRNPENRKRIKDIFGIDIHEDLDIKIVVGRDQYVDKVKVHQKAREYSYKIDIITYDDILNQLLSEHQRVYGIYEQLPGLSFHYLIRFRNAPINQRKYFFDIGKQVDKNRISFYLDETDDICFDVIDDVGRTHEVKVYSQENPILNQWIYLLCEFSITKDGFIMIVGVNGLEKDERVKHTRVNLNIPLQDITLGCDMAKTNFAYFDSAENLIYDRTLTFRDKHRLLKYFLEKYSNLGRVTKYIQFDGHHFMRRNKDGHFVQDEDNFKPRFRVE